MKLSTKQSSERFDLLASDAKEYAIFLMDLNGCLKCWNPGAESLLGYQLDEVVGKNFSLFFSQEDISSNQPECEITTAIADGRSENVLWQIRKDGTKFLCRAVITPLRDENKIVTSYARVMHDLTDGQAWLAQTEANQNKEEFMALLSHELRNPLSPILNAINILRQMKTNDPIIEQAGQIIDRQVTQIVRLVDDLLDISRIVKGKLRIIKENVELRIVVNHAAEAVRALMDGRKHDFSVSLSTEPIWVNADPGRLEQVIVNLLNNAAKYTDTNGLIRMSVQQDGNEAIIRVRDNGIGIESQVVPHIFELFTQIDSSLNRSHGGLGIGLSLVRTLVEMQGGNVQVKSAGLGKGSEFTIRLPTIVVEQKAKTTIESNVRVGQNLRILIVEDNVDAADSLSLLLRLYGHNVQLARTGPTALEMAMAVIPDVVLMDIGLPGMDGYEVAQRLREKPEFKDTMLCALTGHTPTEADRDRQEKTGFNHYYVKPIVLSVLLEMLETIAPRG